MSAQHPTLYVDPDDVARLDATTVVPATRYRDAASDVEYVPASALDDLPWLLRKKSDGSIVMRSRDRHLLEVVIERLANADLFEIAEGR